MKSKELKGLKNVMLIILLLVAGVKTYAQPVISGTIIDQDTQNVVNHPVIIYTDTVGTQYPYYDSVGTDANGFFSFTLPQGMPVGIHFIVETMSCGMPATQTFLYPYNSSMADFTICPVNKYLKGNVYKGANIADLSMVYLIKNQSGNVQLIDSMHAGGNGNFMFTLPLTSTASYMVKAALLPDDTADYIHYIPSYFAGDLKWDAANLLANDNANIDLVLPQGISMQGQGYISGYVQDSLYKRILILTTASDVPVAYRYSNTSGGFSFGGLDYGSYKLFGDDLGKMNPTLAFTLTATNPSITTIVFHETSTAFYGTLFPLDVSAVTKEDALTIYPNPVSDYLHIQGLDKIDGEKKIALCSVNGSVVYSNTVSGNNQVLVPFADLANGLYFLQVNTATGMRSYKIVK